MTNSVRFLILPSASAPAGLGDCQRTITTVRTEANEDKVISTTWQSVDGLRSRQETLGVANPATATRTKPLNGASTSTQTNPDGTSVTTVTTILANGNTQTTASSYSSLPSQSLLSSVSSVSDALGRVTQATNGRGHVTNYTYHGPGGQTASMTQVNAAPGGGNLVTETAYILTPGSGRLVTTTLPDGTFQYQESNLLSQTTRQWGSQTNPVSYTYDSAGRRATLTTYRAPVGTNAHTFPSITGDTTTLIHDPSGVLLEKIHADGNKTTYTYDIAGRLATRTWARGVVTTYGYTAGQLTSVDYSDTTPDVANTYDRLGRQLRSTSVPLVNGQVSVPLADTHYAYDPATLALATETITIDPDGSGPLPSLTRTITRSRDNLRRPTGFVLGNEHAVGYGYDVSGRLATFSAQGLPNLPGKTHAFEYPYEPGSSLLDKVIGPVHEVDNTYEPHRDVLLQKTNTRTVGRPGELSVIGYTVNAIGQREKRNLSGELMEFYGGQSTDLYTTDWGYNTLGQVVVHHKYDPFGPSTRFAYRFSTKPRDPATGLCYFGYRWFDPYAGRWPSRDPIGERGGLNLYAFVENKTINTVDVLGYCLTGWGIGSSDPNSWTHGATSPFPPTKLGPGDVSWCLEDGITLISSCNIVIFVGHNGTVPQGKFILGESSGGATVSCGPGPGFDPAAPTIPGVHPIGRLIDGPATKRIAKDAFSKGEEHARNLCKSSKCCSIRVRIECEMNDIWVWGGSFAQSGLGNFALFRLGELGTFCGKSTIVKCGKNE